MFSNPAAFADLLRQQRPGWSLEQPFYVDADIFKAERTHWFARQWVVVAHASELPSDGTILVRQLFDQEILIIRAGEGDYRAFFNVCTHRGSRLCKEDGRTRLIVCPYHAWSFRPTGELQSRKDVPEGIDPDTLGLHRVPLRYASGLILCGLDESLLPDPSPAIESTSAAMRHHGFERARIAARKVYPTRANWKLVIENFFECYHCRPSHPEYFRSNAHVKVTAISDVKAAQEWEAERAAWCERCGTEGINRAVHSTGQDEMVYAVYRKPIGQGRRSLTADGEPVAPLMGDFTEFDGGETAFHWGGLSFAGATNDYITLFQMVPRGPEHTDVIVTWLVDEKSELGPAEVEAICWLWDVTTQQDKTIVEENAAGVRSIAYRPGPYTALEAQTAEFVATYREQMLKRLGVAKEPDPEGDDAAPNARQFRERVAT